MSDANVISNTPVVTTSEVRELLHVSFADYLASIRQAGQLRRLFLGRNSAPIFVRMMAELNDVELVISRKGGR